MDENLVYDSNKLFTLVNNYVDNIKRNIPQNYNIEYEYKIMCSKRSFMQLLSGMKQYSSICELEQTANKVKNIYTKDKLMQLSNILCKYYCPANKAVKKYNKQRILNAQIFKFDSNVKLSVSLEYDTNHEYNSEKYFYRIKNRLSFYINEWRYDFTQTANIASNIAESQTDIVRSKALSMFSDLASYSGNDLYNKFTASCENIAIQNYEVEIEYLGAKNPLDDKNVFKALGDNSYLKIMYDSVVSNIASLLNISSKSKFAIISFKSMLPSASTLTVNEYNKLYPPINYYISNKADGERALLIIYEDECILFATSQELILASGKLCNENTANNILHVIEGELIDNKVFLAYDVLCINRNLVIDEKFCDRLVLLNEVINDCAKIKSSVEIKIKQTFLITSDLLQSFKNIIGAKFNYKEDGYILTTGDKNYFYTKNYKIKEHNTIDFLAVKLPAKFHKYYNIIQGKHLYLLFNGCTAVNIEKMRIIQPIYYNDLFGNLDEVNYKPVLFAPSDYPHAYLWYVDNKLDKELCEYSKEVKCPLRNFKGETWVMVELARDHANNNWKFHKIRSDRINENNYYGNDYTRTALHTWISSVNPLIIAKMHMPVDNYFNKGKDNAYFAQTAAVSFAKTMLINKIAALIDKKTVVDFAAGKGQDLKRYTNAKFEKALMIDIDKIALMGLIAKYGEMTHDKKLEMSMSLTILHQDLNKPANEVLQNIQNLYQKNYEPFNTIICNLALHYLVETLDSIKNLITNVQNLLAVNGYFLFIIPDGEKIFNLLTENNNDWISKENNSIKYRITAMYKDATFAELGQRVKTKLAFTGEELYEENLVNIDFICKIFAMYGFKIYQRGSIGDFLALFSEKNRTVYNQLSAEDKKFVSLYSYVILQK